PAATTNPRRRSSRYAEATVIGLTPSSAASPRIGGSCRPGPSSPSRIAVSTLPAICRAEAPAICVCSGTLLFLYYSEVMATARTARVAVRRHPERRSYDRVVIDAILHEALYCHVGFVHDSRPFVIPTIHARVGDLLYLHGSPASRMLRELSGEIDVCVTATLLDGIVLARAVYNHSLNYRSVVVLGRARPVEGREERLTALAALVDHVAPGRRCDARQPNDKELAGTAV